MIFSKRMYKNVGAASPILLPTVDQSAAMGLPAIQWVPEAPDEWRKRTDTDGTRRRALQTKRDNELL